MRYGLRAILWAHKVIKGKAAYSSVPSARKANVNKYLINKGYTSLITASDTLVLEAEVTLTGADLAASAFSATLSGSSITSQTKVNAANGKIAFDAISYDNDDIGEEYTYTVTMNVPDPAVTGYTYDLSEYTVTVEPYRNTGNPNDIEFDMEIKKTKDSSGNAIDSPTTAESIAFAVTYASSDEPAE